MLNPEFSIRPEQKLEINSASRAWQENSTIEAKTKTQENISLAIDKLNNKPDTHEIEKILDSLQPAEWVYYLESLNLKATNFTTEILSESKEKGQINELQVDADRAHYEEVTQLAQKFTKIFDLNREQTVRTVLAARLHDCAKLAFREGASPMQTLYLHEIMSAVAIEKALPDLVSEAPKEYGALVAATAASHGRGEFPQLLAGKMGAEYYALPLAENDLPSVIVHLSDVLQGIFGRSEMNGKEIIGESWWKYATSHIKTMKDFSVEKSMDSALKSVMTNSFEVVKTTQDLPQKENADVFLQEMQGQQGLAQAFYTFAGQELGASFTETGTIDTNALLLSKFGSALQKFRSLSRDELDQKAATGLSYYQSVNEPKLLSEWEAELTEQIKNVSLENEQSKWQKDGTQVALNVLREIEHLKETQA